MYKDRLYNETYLNNNIYGSKCKPVIFDKIERVRYKGEVVDVIVANHEFFKDLQCGKDTDFRRFFGVFAFCSEFGDTRQVFIKDGKCGRLIPLRTEHGGFNIRMDQIQPLCDVRAMIHLVNCYDCGNPHINILSKIYPKHRRCFNECGCESEGCGCEKEWNHVGECECELYENEFREDFIEGYKDGYDGYGIEDGKGKYASYKGFDAMNQPV